MKWALSVCACLLMLALTAAVLAVAFNHKHSAYRYMVDELKKSVDGRLADVQGQVAVSTALLSIELEKVIEQQLELSRQDVRVESRLWRRQLSQNLEALTAVADKRLSSIQNDANVQGILLQRTIAVNLDRAIDGVDSMSTEAAAVLVETRRTVRDLHPQLLGLAAAGKITMGETAQTMRVVRDRTPAAADATLGTLRNAEQFTFGLSNPFRPIGRGFKWLGRKIKTVF